MRSPASRTRGAILAGVLGLALLAWQGDRLAHGIPWLERAIAQLGPWGPAAMIAAIVVLAPLLVPDSIFGLVAGASFGLAAGTLYFFAGVYLASLVIQGASSRFLGARVLRLLERRPTLRAAIQAAPQGGVRFVLLLRMLPINQALLSYALGAVGMPLRSAAVGNLAMLTHLFPTVYLGVAAVHVTRMAGASHRAWEAQGVLLLVGLGATVLLALEITKRAWAAIAAVDRGDGGRAAERRTLSGS